MFIKKYINIYAGLINKLYLALTITMMVLFIAYSPSFAIPNPPEQPSNDANVSANTNTEHVNLLVQELPKADSKELAKAVKYPEFARETGLEGQVILQVLVSKEGKAKNIEVVSSTDKIFEKSAIKAVKKITFEPGKYDGNPVDAWVSIPISFKLDNK